MKFSKFLCCDTVMTSLTCISSCHGWKSTCRCLCIPIIVVDNSLYDNSYMTLDYQVYAMPQTLLHIITSELHDIGYEKIYVVPQYYNFQM